MVICVILQKTWGKFRDANRDDIRKQLARKLV